MSDQIRLTSRLFGQLQPSPGRRMSVEGTKANRTNVNDRLHAERAAGGFTRDDHRVVFFGRVNALLPKDAVVLEFGAGRGKFGEIESDWKRDLTCFRGKARHVIGVDPDPVVAENPDLDEGHCFTIGEPLPIPDASVDFVTSWAVFEHVEQAEFYARELERVLKPGGWMVDSSSKRNVIKQT